ncbi:unnamed protein product [Diplocarpon coronariae]|nr:hypothetical protein JHW43_002820 [Diplocarpon mali]
MSLFYSTLFSSLGCSPALACCLLPADCTPAGNQNNAKLNGLNYSSNLSFCAVQTRNKRSVVHSPAPATRLDGSLLTRLRRDFAIRMFPRQLLPLVAGGCGWCR